ASTLVDLAFSPTEEAFCAELRGWLRTHLPPPAEPATLADEVAFLRAWQRQLHDGRWVGIHWPREYGGRGASVVEHYIFQEEMAAARAPEILNRIGVNLVGPTLIAHGSEAQKRRFLPQILPADELWCQLFSEPVAGSDLTALRTRAERRGDGWAVTGQTARTSAAPRRASSSSTACCSTTSCAWRARAPTARRRAVGTACCASASRSTPSRSRSRASTTGAR